MDAFIVANLDFVFFAYFIGFLTLLTTCFLLQRVQPENKFWLYLGFASTSFLLSLLLYVIRTFQDYYSPYLFVLEIMFMSITFLIFIQYARRQRWTAWIISLFVLVVVLGALYNGIKGVDMFIEAIVGPISSIWLAYVILTTFPIERKTCSRAMAISIFIFGVVQFVVAIFPSESPIVTKIYFLAFINIMFMNLVVWRWFRKVVSDQIGVNRKIYISLVIFLFVLLASWLVVDYAGKIEGQRSGEELLSRARTAAAAVNPERVIKVTGSIQDLKDPDYIRLKEQFYHVMKENKDARFLYMIKRDKKGRIIFLVDAEPVGSKDYSAPGDEWKEPPVELLEAIKTQQDVVIGPYTDQWGSWVSAFVPVKDFKTGRALSMLGFDISVKNWSLDIKRARFDAIVVSFIIFILILSISTLYYLTKISAITIRKSEEKFSKAFEKSPMMSAITKLSDGRIIDVNSTFLNILEFRKKDVIGKTTLELNIFKDPKDREKLVELVEKQGFAEKLQINARSSKGKDVIGLMYAVPIELYGESYLISNIEDVTQKVTDERLLKEKTEELERFFDVSVNMLCVTDNDGRFRKISSACRHILGYEPQELENKMYIDLVHPDDVEITLAVASQILSGSMVKSFTNRYKKKDGTYVWIEWDSTVEQEGMVYSSARDVTEKKKLSDELKESEKKFKTMVENIPGTTYRCLPDKYWTMSFLSSDVEVLTGYPAADFLLNKVRSYSSVIHPEDTLYVENIINDAIKTNNAWELEYRILHKDGTIKWVYEKGKSVKNEKGNIEHLDGILIDVTERKSTEAQVKRLSLAVEQSPATVVLTNTDGNIEYANPKFTQTTGYTLQEAIGKNPRILKSGELPAETYKKLWDTISSGKEWRGEFHNKKKDGTFFWEQASIAPVFDDKGKIMNYLAVKEDITHRKEIEFELAQAKDSLEKAMKVKDEFLSVTSHDLKSPLGIVKTSMSLLLDEPNISEQVKDYAQMSLRQANRGIKLITDLLNLKKLEDGNIKLEMKKFNVSLMVQEVVDDLKGAIELNNVTVEYLTQADYEVTADYDKLKQVLSNLLDNSLKYTQKDGKIEINTLLVDGSLRLSIRDFGRGIPEDKLALIFDKYEQVNEKTDRQKGHGIGLAIARMICELHGGKIWAESKEGQGSTFYFEIPNANLCGVNDNSTCSVVDPSQRTILVVDDLQDERKIVKDILGKEGFITLEAGGWEQALKVIRNYKVDAVILDIEMPEINGLELLEIIRRERSIDQLPVLLYSSRFKDIEDYHKYGANDYANKGSIAPSALLLKLKKMIRMA